MSDRVGGALPESLFVVSSEDEVTPTELARGPWDPRSLHGAPVAALLAGAVEGVRYEGVDWFVTRLTIELERPVPLAPLRLGVVVSRPGR